MKKGKVARFAAVLTALMLTVMPLQASAAANDNEIADYWNYVTTEIEWTDTDIYINGFFYNRNESTDIYDIRDFELILFDSADNVMVSGEIENGGLLEEIVIPSACTVAFRFAFDLKNFDITQFDLTDGYESEINCRFSYIGCGGIDKCKTCADWRDYQYDDDNHAHDNERVGLSGSIADDGYIGCKDCENGFIVCSYCNGTAKSVTSGFSTGLVYGDLIMNAPCAYCEQGYNICRTCKGMGFVKNMNAVSAAAPEGYAVCENCYKGYYRCSYCQGTGEKHVLNVISTCTFCQGGFIKCEACKATGFVKTAQHPAKNTPPPPVPIKPGAANSNTAASASTAAPLGGNASAPQSGGNMCTGCDGKGSTNCTVCDGSGYVDAKQYITGYGVGEGKYIDIRRKCIACDYGKVRCKICGGLGKTY